MHSLMPGFMPNLRINAATPVTIAVHKFARFLCSTALLPRALQLMADATFLAWQPSAILERDYSVI